MSKNLRCVHVLGALVLTTGCSQPSPQVVKGSALLSTFPSTLAPSRVRVVRGERVVAHADLAADGSFRLAIPRGRGYQLRFASAAGETVLVMPQPDGTTRDRFDVRGGRPFDLGVVRQMTNMASTRFVFTKTGSATTCADGVDGDSHGPCIELDDAKSCEGDDGEGHHREGEERHADREEQNGHPEEDDHADGDRRVEPASTTEAAVAEHDLSRNTGCGEQSEE